MKTSSKIALALGAVAAFLFAKKKQSVSGIGAFYINDIDQIRALQLFKAFDDSFDTMKWHNAQTDAIFKTLENDGVDLEGDDGERLFNSIAHKLGLVDVDGNTDVYVNYANARKELLNFIYHNILPKFPLPKEDLELLINNRNIQKQNELINITRKYIGA